MSDIFETAKNCSVFWEHRNLRKAVVGTLATSAPRRGNFNRKRKEVQSKRKILKVRRGK